MERMMCGYCTELMALQHAWVDSRGGLARAQLEQKPEEVECLQEAFFPVFLLQESTGFGSAIKQYIDKADPEGDNFYIASRLIIARLRGDVGALHDPAIKARLDRLLPDHASNRSLPDSIQQVCRKEALLDDRRWQRAMQSVYEWQTPCAIVLQKFIARYFGKQQGLAGLDTPDFAGWLPAAFFAATLSAMHGNNTALLDALVCHWPAEIPGFDGPELWLQRHIVAERTAREGTGVCYAWVRAGIRPNLLVYAVTRNRWDMAIRQELANALAHEAPEHIGETEDAILWLRDETTTLPGVLQLT